MLRHLEPPGGEIFYLGHSDDSHCLQSHCGLGPCNEPAAHPPVPLLRRRLLHQHHTPERTNRIGAFHSAHTGRGTHRTRTFRIRRQTGNKREVRIGCCASPIRTWYLGGDLHRGKRLSGRVGGYGTRDGSCAVGVELVECHGHNTVGGGDLRDGGAGCFDLGREASC